MDETCCLIEVDSVFYIIGKLSNPLVQVYERYPLESLATQGYPTFLSPGPV